MALKLQLLLKFGALALIACFLIIITRENNRARTIKSVQTPLKQSQLPVVESERQPFAPLEISAARFASSELQSTEITYRITNVGQKTIRAFAIQETVEAEGLHRGNLKLINLDLSNSELQQN